MNYSDVKGRIKRSLAIVLSASMLMSGSGTSLMAEELSDTVSDDYIAEYVSEDSADEVAEYVSEDVADTVADSDVGPEVTPPDGEGEYTEVSRNSISRMDIGARNTLVAPTNAKCTIDKKGQVVISWKKVKGAKQYFVYRMKKNGMPDTKAELFATKKTKIKDSGAAQGEILAYMIVASGKDASGTEGKGEPAFVVATPVITDIQRRDDSDDLTVSDARMNIKYTTIPGATEYVIERSSTKNKNFAPLENGREGVNVSQDGNEVSTNYTFKKGGTMKQEVAIDGSSLTYGKYYYYKVAARYYVAGISEPVESQFSAVVSGRMTARAPKLISANMLSGTRVQLIFENLNNTVSSSRTRMKTSDYYQIYTSTGGKYKKFVQAKTKDLKVLSAEEVNRTVSPVNGKAVSFDCVAYEVEKLKLDKEYGFKVSAVTEKVEGALSDPIIVKTRLTEVSGIEFVDSNLNTATISWDQVEGAKGYKVYYTEAYKKDESILGKPVWEWGTSPFSKVLKVPNKAVNKKVTATIKGLKNLRYYGIKVVALGNKNLEVAQPATSQNCILVQAKIAKPKVTVKEVKKDNKTSLKFSWKKVSKATGYKVQYYVPATPDINMEKTVSVNFMDTNTYGVGIEYLKASQTSFTIDKIKGPGYPVVCKITTLYEKDGASKFDEDSQGNYYMATEYVTPEKPKVEWVLCNDNTIGSNLNQPRDMGAAIGLTFQGERSENNGFYIPNQYNTDTSQKAYFDAGYVVERSYSKNKDFEELSDFISKDSNYKPYGQDNRTDIYGINLTTENNFTIFRDNDYLAAGDKVYYRIYQAYRNKAYPDVIVKSRSYVQKEFCAPYAIKDATVNVKVNQSVKVTLKYDSKKATAPQIYKYQLSGGNGQNYMSVSLNNVENEYAMITKTSPYSDKMISSGDNEGKYGYNQTFTLKGLKKGTTYIRAITINGVVGIITVKVGGSSKEEKESKKSSSSSKKDKSSSSSKDKKVIVLDPGHGGSDGGCSYGNLKEKELNLKISKYTKSKLEDKGFKVYMTRTGDSYVELEERVTMYADREPAALISQHINSGNGNGVECYYSIDGTGKELASKLCSVTAEKTGMKNRGAKKKESETNKGVDYYAIIRHSRESKNNIMGLIMENGFVQNDSSYMDTDDKLKTIGHANASAISDYFK